ncbi:SusD family protein [Fodinibius roseus]|uniref:SusD family protein n=1 Tax=Fodinibius roseus TaxID=1194090 RepID=A0A1M5AJH5_9BACT|nr:RagB/SusD family nutrient uptake outer membrane protein [Fodinibius roseus]SHF30305.1 SusD family protein [Fodinibius roseus]
MKTQRQPIVVVFLTAIMIMLTAFSCRDWLSVTPNSQIRADEQFESESGFKNALTGVYVGMTSTDSYAKDLSWNMVDILSRQYAPFTSGADYYDLQEYEYGTTFAAGRIDAVWQKSYNTIADINNILEYLEENREVLDDYDHDIIKGELLGLRAFLHFDLLRLFGYGNLEERAGLMSEAAVPYVTDYSKEIPPRRSYEETFRLLNEDLEEGLELLQSDPIYEDPDRSDEYENTIGEEDFYDNRKVRMNYYALRALQARALLWQGGMEHMNSARRAAEEVISDGPAELIDGQTYDVGSDPILSPEVLFSLDVNGFEDIVNPLLTATDVTDYDALYLSTETTNELYETDNVNVGPPDIRYNSLLDDQSLGYVSVKLLQSDNTAIPSRNILPLIKMPEMYYIAAEYYLNNGELQPAINYLNRVRTSRGIIEEIPDDADAETVEEELYKEYRKEYVSEGQLFFFYKRWGVPSIPGLSESVNADDDIYVLPYPDSESIFR